MKLKKVLLIASLPFVTGIAFSQAVEQGSFIADVYYGAPNFGKSIYKSVENAAGTSSFKASGIGPLGLRAEYMVADRIGVGVDIIYNSNNVSYSQTDTTGYDSDAGTYTTETNTYERTMDRLRIQARFNYHFDVSNPNLDAYFGVGAGSNNRFRNYYKNGSELPEDDLDLSKFTVIPVSFRLCTGMRYYFTENIGLNAEIGLGGPLISAGISLKF